MAVEDGLVGLLLADLAPRGASVRAADGAEPGGPDAPGGPGGPGGAYERGALPLLSHAMLATWEHSRGGTLAVADYLASGGIKDALTQTAERAYGSLTPDQQRLARRLFLRLVHVADDLPPSRATVELGELRDWGGDAEAVLATFVDERMITVDAGTAQITHDALLTAWPRLRSWIEAAWRACAPAGGSPRAPAPGRTPAGRAPRCGAAASSRSPGTGRPTRTTALRCRRWPPGSSPRRSPRTPLPAAHSGAVPGGCTASSRCWPPWSSPSPC